MIYRARVRILPLVAIIATALAVAACAADLAEFSWPLRFAIRIIALLGAILPAYWLGGQSPAVTDGAGSHRTELASLAGHEMKTPLTGIKAYVELLADGDAEDEATRSEFLAGISSQVERLERAIDGLLGPTAELPAPFVEQSQPSKSILSKYPGRIG
jgi:signal transduction histidine kinase